MPGDHFALSLWRASSWFLHKMCRVEIMDDVGLSILKLFQLGLSELLVCNMSIYLINISLDHSAHHVVLHLCLIMVIHEFLSANISLVQSITFHGLIHLALITFAREDVKSFKTLSKVIFSNNIDLFMIIKRCKIISIDFHFKSQVIRCLDLNAENSYKIIAESIIK